MSKEQMETDILRFMNMLEPTCLQGSQADGDSTFEFMFYAGYLVAAANGVVENSELQSLAQMVGAAVMSQGMERIKIETLESVQAYVKGLSEKIHLTKPMVAKLNMIRDLCVISASDGFIEPSEVTTIYRLCDWLHIRREFADQTLQGMMVK